MNESDRDVWRARWLVRGGLWCLPVVFTAFAGHEVGRLERYASSPYPVEGAPRYSAHSASRADALPELDQVPIPVSRALAPGQTLLRVFQDLGLPPGEAHAAAGAASEHLDPRRLRAGDSFSAYLREEGTLARVVFEVEDRGEVEVRRASGGWRSDWRPYRVVTSEEVVSGELDAGLESAVRAAGAPPLVAYRLADVFQWDLDFTRDLRLGDRFNVLYEEVRTEGRTRRVGEIRAAVYENQGRRLEAYRFGDDDGYYDAEGRPLQKQFLRSPLEFSRVTSRFSARRFHPVLKTYRPHYGVDYGAATGTPVRVTASGVVVSVGWSNGGGKTVKVRHPNGYQTGYLHLSRYADGLRAGTRVRQGEVVGFVGATGLATAPHLDYRVQHNGRYIDPLSVRNEPAPPLDAIALERFLVLRDELRARLGEPRLDPGVASTIGG
ncbi:MAG TPA: peptidoglycan DD-metalloendopeptidase family protein [Thermoanaerobaculia bacterium]|nr:peptidoglycan DD-metalloendopeptidase family protein [Thermoanaerobaculia bacterium]